jgi:hypothetical protein
MRLNRILIFFLILQVSLFVCPAQDIGDTQPEENWLKEYNLYREQFMYFRYDKYSKDDVIRLRAKLDQLKSASYEKEWEGVYYQGFDDPIGHSQFRVSFDKGFASIYVYTCLPELRAFSIGSVVDSPDSIQLVSDRSKAREGTKYIRVRWGDRFYLVEESSLPAFSEKAVGILPTRNDDQSPDRFNWMNFWILGDLDKPLQGLPQFPASYKKFERRPITAKIMSVKRSLTKNESDDSDSRWESAVYTVAIDAGTAKGIKPDMVFLLADTGDILTITKVSQTRAVGTITRPLNENTTDNCWDDNNNDVPCRRIVPGMRMQTQIGKFDL